ncbi:MAG: hypothetical protein E6G45_08130 [Actinobacteria bacterium]|nr:MAG: hypothetical protein E6G45_08130 [Actinomycetota bacterium]
MDADDRLRLDYEQTMQLVRALTDIRFRLLAFVPTIAAAAVGFLGRPRPAVELLSIGLLGLGATFGILIYELRNSQVFDAALHRAKQLERTLGLPAVRGGEGSGGVLSESPGDTVRLFGVLPLSQGRGLALVYGAALAGWSYLVAWGALRAIDVGHPRAIGVVIGAVAALAIILEIERINRL